MTTSGRSEIGQMAVVAAMFLAGLLTLPTAPRYIPMHWDANGDVDVYGDPLMGLFLIPGIALITYLLLRFLPALDPGRSNYATFARPYGFLSWVSGPGSGRTRWPVGSSSGWARPSCSSRSRAHSGSFEHRQRRRRSAGSWSSRSSTPSCTRTSFGARTRNASRPQERFLPTDPSGDAPAARGVQTIP